MISIAMTTYNGERFLREQIDSILAQSIADWELVICDDCSSDSTWQILEEYALTDSRIRIFKNATNLGFVKNFERAILLCTGDYIALCDQDDVWIGEHLEILMSAISSGTAAVGDARIMDADGGVSSDVISRRERYFVDGDDADKLCRILCYGNPFQGASSLFRRELFEKALPIPRDVDYHDAWFNAFACCMNGLNFVPAIVSNYRIFGGNASGNHKLTFREQVRIAFRRRGWNTDRIIFCDELLSRIPEMTDEKKRIVLIAKEFHENRVHGKRLKTIKTILKHYKKIYSTNNYKQAFARCIGILLRG